MSDSRPSTSSLDLSALLGSRERTTSPWMAAAFSLFLYPGAGQMMNRSTGKALFFGLIFTFLAAWSAYYLVAGIFEIFAPEARITSPFPADSWRLGGLSVRFSRALLWGGGAAIFYLWSALDAWLESRRLRSQSPAPVKEAEDG